MSRWVDVEVFKDSCDSQCVLSPAYGPRCELSAIFQTICLQFADTLPCHVGLLTPLNHCKPSKAILLYTTLATVFYHISRKVTNTDLCYKICGSTKKKEKTDPTNCGDFCADGFGKYNNQNFPRDWCIPIHCSRCFCGS